MKKSTTWIILGVLVVLVLILLAFLPVRQRTERADERSPGQEIELSTEFPFIPSTPLATPLPTETPEVLTPEKLDLSDLETETKSLNAESELDSDIRGIETDLRGI